MLNFSQAKPDEQYKCRDGHIAYDIHIEGDGILSQLSGKVTPVKGSVYEQIGVSRMQWQFNGRVRNSVGSAVSGFDLIEKLTSS